MFCLLLYVKLQVARAPGMTRTFSPPLPVSVPDMYHGTCVTHVPWCMPGSLTSGFLWSWWRENVPGIPGVCITRRLTYLVRGPWRYYVISLYREFINEQPRCGIWQEQTVLLPSVSIKGRGLYTESIQKLLPSLWAFMITSDDHPL